MNRSTVKPGAVWIVLPVALVTWAVIALLHPDPDSSAGIYAGLHDDVGSWLFTHCAQLVLAPFVAFTVWTILRGVTSAAATLSRLALVVWLVSFSAYDSLAGIGTGVLVREANSVTGDEQAGLVTAADLFWDSQLSGNVSWWGVVATIAWPVVAVAAAVALHRDRASRVTVAAMAVSGLVAFHAGFPATVGFTALAVAVVGRLTRAGNSPEGRRRRSGGRAVIPSLLTPRDGGIVTADGRRLAFAEYGDPIGRPCLYFHFTPGSRLDPLVVFHDNAELLDGIRLVAIDRPGFGRSDRQPGRTFLDWPADVTAVTDQLGIDTFSVLGISGGGGYALACAYCDP